MTIKEVNESRQIENAKHDALEAVITIIEKLRKDLKNDGDDAVEWLMEKINE